MSAPANIRGFGDASVRVLETHEIEAWVSTLPDAFPLSSNAEALRLHDRVVAAAMASGRTPLPARFGQRFVDDAACLTDISARAHSLHRGLERIDGNVELAVLVVARGNPAILPATVRPIDPGSAGAGHQYLEAVRARDAAEERRQLAVDQQLDEIDRAVAPFSHGSARGRPRGIVAGSVAHLIERSVVDRFRDAVSLLIPMSDFQLVLTDVRAPYSFSDVAGSSGTILAG